MPGCSCASDATDAFRVRQAPRLPLQHGHDGQTSSLTSMSSSLAADLPARQQPASCASAACSVLVLEKSTSPFSHRRVAVALRRRRVGRAWADRWLKRRFIVKPAARFIHNESGAEFTYITPTPSAPTIRSPMKSPRPNSTSFCCRDRPSWRRCAFRPRGARRRNPARRRARGMIQPEQDDHRSVHAQVFVDATGRDTLLGALWTEGRRRSDHPTWPASPALKTAAASGAAMKATSPSCWLRRRLVVVHPLPRRADIGRLHYCRSTSPHIAAPCRRHISPLRWTPRWQCRPCCVAPPALTDRSDWQLVPSLQTVLWRSLPAGRGSAGFIDPPFSTGVLMAVVRRALCRTGRSTGDHSGDMTARASPLSAASTVGAPICSSVWSTSSGRKPAQAVRALRRAHPATCAVITSMLAGDVHRPALWANRCARRFSRLHSPTVEFHRVRCPRPSSAAIAPAPCS